MELPLPQHFHLLKEGLRGLMKNFQFLSFFFFFFERRLHVSNLNQELLFLKKKKMYIYLLLVALSLRYCV